jgi:putative signal transducing protein
VAELAVLQVVNSEPEAEIICQLLRSEGIPAIVQRTNFGAGMADGFPSALGPREVVVHAKNLARAREILERTPPV